jgi:hypothetical protein
MPASDEHIPDYALCEAIVVEAVRSKIIEMACDLCLATDFRILISVRGEDEAAFGPDTATWTIRLIVRHTFEDSRKNFQAHVWVAKDARTGFSGFNMSGVARITLEGVTIQQKGWTANYNTEPAKTWR